MADMKRETQQAKDEAIRYAMAIIFTVLVDKFGGLDYLPEIWEAVKKLSAEIVEGRVSLNDLVHTLQAESDVYL